MSTPSSDPTITAGALAGTATLDLHGALDSLDARQSIQPHVDAARRAMLERSEPGRAGLRTPLGVLASRVEALPPVSLRATEGGDLVVMSLLGEGGMGRVDLAHQRALARDVALKRVRRDRFCEASVDALLREARFTGSLEHPNIVPVHLLGRDEGGEPVLVMKRVEGVAWSELLADPTHPAWGDHVGDRLGRNLEILSQVCNALHFAHSRGVLHRDVKAENVMLGSFGEVYLVDWGIAVHLDAPPVHELAGTPAHLAPEMLEGTTRIGVRTDVFLLGSLLHFVLMGAPRHTGTSTSGVLAAAARCEPVAYPPSVPPELAALCNRATARNPAERPATAVEFRQALTDYLRHRGSVALSDAAAARLAALHEALAGLPATPPDRLDLARAEVRRLAAESAYGFRQALRDWPENPAGRGGLRECLAVSAGFEIDQRNPVGAGTLLSELADIGGEDAELAARLAELRAAMEEEARAQATLRRLEHDANAAFAIEERSGFLIVSHLAAGAGWGAMGRTGLQVSYTAIFVFSIGLFVSLAGTFWVLRNTLLANRFNRRFMYCMMAFCTFTALIATIGVLRDLPVEELAWSAYIGSGLMFAVMAVAMSPWAGLLVPPAVVGAFFVAVYPDRTIDSLAWFNVACAVMWSIQLGFVRVRGASRPKLV